MKKKFRLLGALFATALLCALGAVPAFAADQTLTVDASTANGSLTVNKHVVVDKDAPIPAETFTFTLTPVANTTGMTDEGQAIKSGVAVTTNSATIGFTNASGTTAGSATSDSSGITTSGSAQKYATNTGTISFAGATFTQPGIYRYSLEETAGSTAGMSYEQSKFYVDVLVGYSSATADAGPMSILGVKTYRYVDANGSAIAPLGAKANNQFVNRLATERLEVSKTVTGNMGDRTKDFRFSLTVPASTQLTAGTTLTAVKMAASGTTSNVTVTVGTACSFNLKHGEKLVVKGLPRGTSYTVAESDYAGDSYTTSLVTTKSGVATASTEVRTITNEVVSGGNAEAFTNNKNITTPTGVLLDVAPYVLIVVVAGGAAVWLVSRRRNAAK